MFQLRRATSVSLVLSALVLASACAQNTGSGAALAENSGNAIGCPAFADTFWDELYKFPTAQKEFPTETEMREHFTRAVSEGRLKSLSDGDKNRAVESLVELYRLVALESKNLAMEEEVEDKTFGALVQLELGDRSTPEKAAIQDRIEKEMKVLEDLAATLESAAPCTDAKPAPAEPSPGTSHVPTPAPTPSAGGSSTLLSNWKANLNPAVYGARKTMATSYQSCDAVSVAPLDASVPNLQGIKIVGKAGDGIGSLREISDVGALVRSHPYLRNYRRPRSSCYDVLSNPPIYDYGGRPVTSGDPGTFDMFRNQGGTKVLGTDCSGFAYMALATAGLKVKPAGRLKAVTVHGITSRSFVNPKATGLTCLDYAKFSGSSSLRPGDILAKPGHVLLIDSIGTDPFGISGISRVEDCKVANMSVKRFNFTIIQSASSKNGLVAQRTVGSEYLPEAPEMMVGMLEHAVAACKAKFGATVTASSSKASLVRHTGSASCKDSEIKMARESCVASCPVKQ